MHSINYYIDAANGVLCTQNIIPVIDEFSIQNVYSLFSGNIMPEGLTVW